MVPTLTYLPFQVEDGPCPIFSGPVWMNQLSAFSQRSLDISQHQLCNIWWQFWKLCWVHKSPDIFAHSHPHKVRVPYWIQIQDDCAWTQRWWCFVCKKITSHEGCLWKWVKWAVESTWTLGTTLDIWHVWKYADNDWIGWYPDMSWEKMV